MKDKVKTLSRNLMRVHKLLLENERIAAEGRLGRPLAPLDFFNLLTQDRNFAWLKPISALIAEIDEFIDEAELVSEKDLATIRARVEFILLDSKSKVAQRYLRYLSQDTDLVIAHADLRANLGAQAKLEPITYKGIRIQVAPVNAATIETPLEMVCFFDQTKTRQTPTGTEHFRGDLFETLLLTPPKGEVPAEKLLLIGLGDPAAFSLDRVTALGTLVVREAIKFSVSSFAFSGAFSGDVAADLRLGAEDVKIALPSSTDLANALANGVKTALLIADSASLKEMVFLAGTNALEVHDAFQKSFAS